MNFFPSSNGVKDSDDSFQKVKAYFVEKADNFVQSIRNAITAVKNVASDAYMGLYSLTSSQEHIEELHFNFSKNLKSIANNELKVNDPDRNKKEQADGTKGLLNRRMVVESLSEAYALSRDSDILEVIEFIQKDSGSNEINGHVDAVDHGHEVDNPEQIDLHGKENDAPVAKINTLNFEQHAYLASRLKVIRKQLEKSLIDKKSELDKANLVQAKYEDVLEQTTRLQADCTKLNAQLACAINSSATASQELQRQHFLISEITSLEQEATLVVTNLARERMIDRFTEILEPIVKPGYLHGVNGSASLGASVGLPTDIPFISLHVKGLIDSALSWSWTTDDEGYPAEAITGALGLTLGFEAVASFTKYIKAGVEGMIAAKVTLGTYKEVRNLPQFVNRVLHTLMHDPVLRADPEIARYMSMAAILDLSLDKNNKPSTGLLAVTRNEFTEIDSAKRNYDLLKSHREMQHSLHANSISQKNINPGVWKDFKDNPKLDNATKQNLEKVHADSCDEAIELERLARARERGDQVKIDKYQEKLALRKRSNPLVALPEVKTAVINAFDGDTIAISGKLEGKAEAQFEIPKILADKPAFSSGVSAGAEYCWRALSAVVETPFCQLMSHEYQSDDKKKIVRDGVDREFNRFRGKLEQSLQYITFNHPRKKTPENRRVEILKMLNSVDKDRDGEVQKTKEGLSVGAPYTYVSEDAFIGYLKKNELNPDLLKLYKDAVTHLKIHDIKADILGLEDTVWNFFEMRQLQDTLKKLMGETLSLEMRTELKVNNGLAERSEAFSFDADLKKSFDYVNADFEELNKLQVGITVRGYKNQADEILLQQFAARYGAANVEQLLHRMVIANAYLYSKSDDVDLKKAILALEKKMLNPHFEHDRAYIKSHANFVEGVVHKRTETRVTGEFHLGEKFLFGAKGSVKGDVLWWTNEHTNSWRDGDYCDFKLTFEGELGDVATFMRTTAPAILNLIKPSTEELKTQLLGQIKSAFEFASVGIGAKKGITYMWRFLTPTACEGKLPEVMLFYRRLDTSETGLKVSGSIPLVVADLRGELGVVGVCANTSVEEFSPKSFIYALGLAGHEYASENYNKDTGKINERSRWFDEKKNQQEYFKQIFSNYGAESDDEERVGTLSYELKTIAEDFKGKYGEGSDAWTKFKNAGAALRLVAKQYKDKSCSADSAQADLDLALQEAIKAFEFYVEAHFPRWKDLKVNSLLRKSKDVAPV